MRSHIFSDSVGTSSNFLSVIYCVIKSTVRVTDIFPCFVGAVLLQCKHTAHLFVYNKSPQVTFVSALNPSLLKSKYFTFLLVSRRVLWLNVLKTGVCLLLLIIS